jgi:3-dehydroquinate synthase
MGMLDAADYERVISLTRRAGLPASPPADIAPPDLLGAMRLDKKNRGGRTRLVLLRAIGDAFLCDDYPDREFQQVLESGRTGSA